MAGFCGVRQNALSVKGGVLKNECFIDVLNLVPHALFSVFSLFILIVWNRSAFGRIEVTTWVQFKGHNVRWITTVLLILNIIFGLLEGIMTETSDPDITNLHVVVPQCVALCAVILSIIFYHNLEQWNSPRFLLSFILYWTCATIFKSLKLFSLLENNVTTEHVRFWVTSIDIVLYVVLLLTEMVFLYIQVMYKNN